jgi:hypothetical protein
MTPDLPVAGGLVSVLVPLCLLLGQAGSAEASAGFTYQVPQGWAQKAEGGERTLVATPARPGQFLMVLVTPARLSSGEAVRELEQAVRALEAGGRRLSQGKAQSQEAGGLTRVTLTTRVDQPPTGVHDRIYQLVTDGRRSSLVVVMSRGEETLAANRAQLAQLLVSFRPGPGAGAHREAPPPPPGEAGAGGLELSGIPYGPSDDTLLDKRFRPSGHGTEIPVAALVDGEPLGMWWHVHRSTLPGVASGSIYPTVFLPDGTAAQFPVPGGPRTIDLEKMRAGRSRPYLGRWSASGEVLTTVYGDSRRSGRMDVRRGERGPTFLWDHDEYNPCLPPGREFLIGTWQLGAKGAFTFHPDGTVTTVPQMIDAQWTHGHDEPLTGRWFVDGYLLALRFPKDGDRVFQVFKASSGGLVVNLELYERTR